MVFIGLGPIAELLHDTIHDDGENVQVNRLSINLTKMCTVLANHVSEESL